MATRNGFPMGCPTEIPGYPNSSLVFYSNDPVTGLKAPLDSTNCTPLSPYDPNPRTFLMRPYPWCRDLQPAEKGIDFTYKERKEILRSKSRRRKTDSPNNE